VWGTSTPGAQIIAKLGNAQAIANKEGKWQIMPLGGGSEIVPVVES
jgi:hypothetical protein